MKKTKKLILEIDQTLCLVLLVELGKNPENKLISKDIVRKCLDFLGWDDVSVECFFEEYCIFLEVLGGVVNEKNNRLSGIPK